MQSDSHDAPRRSPRRLWRALLVLVVVGAVVAGPTLAYRVLWDWPRHALPEVGLAQDVSQSGPGVDPALSDRLMAEVRAGRAAAGVPSLSAALATVDGLSWAGASGWADVERREPATPASRYRTGSVAKPVTAVALMRLVEEGRVALDAPASGYVSGLPPELAAVTARQLASHTAGVRHYSQRPVWWPGWHEVNSTRHYQDVAEGLSLFVDDPLLFPPGTGFAYSTFGYSLLSRMLEGVAARPFPALLAEQVFVPARMADTAVDAVGAMPGRVAFYEAAHGRYTEARGIDSSYKIAGGGLVSTPADLARLGVAIQDGSLLSEANRQAMWTPQPLADGRPNPQGYALGWRVAESTQLTADGRPIRIVHHGGTQAGAAAYLLVLPDHGLAVAAMANASSGREQAQATAFALAREVLAARRP